ncbi:histidinol-phosphate transaminase [Chryseolinea sp. T2]|uniref:histidinol-phosphate transaminase n=1 Tax=Chryseolinea sp. T2 TaxID=3129255 RepID=UPI0030771E92
MSNQIYIRPQEYMPSNATFDLNALVRDNVRRMKPYSSARDEFSGEAEVFLDANENPYPSPFNRYPDPLQSEVKRLLSPLKGVTPEQTFLGNGSDEAIDLLIRAFCEPNRDSIIITEPTYGMYSVCANVNAVRTISLTLDQNFDLDLSLFPALNDPSLKLIFLCSPNNPSANLLNRERIIQLLEQFQGLVVVDEAYIDFTTAPSFTTELSKYPNLVILQTFSKAWGLAGLRLGMCFASKEIIAVLNKIKYPYNVNIKTQELAVEALSNKDQKDRWVKEILQERTRLIEALQGLTITQKVYPSDANFVLVKVTDAPGIYKRLMNIGIIVRDRSNVRLCDNCLRITVGTQRENDKLIDALKQIVS